jgi:hypothetical protein
MTISAPNFTRLQDGIKSVDDLRVRGPLNVALAYLSGSLVTQLNTHFDAVSNSISAALVTFLSTANTWTAIQTIQPASNTPLVIRFVDDANGAGPVILADRSSTTPAAADNLGGLLIRGRDASINNTDYVFIGGQIVDPTSGSEDGRMILRTLRAAANSDWRIESGTLYHSTQTLPSNEGEVAAAAYKVGASQVVGARVTGYGDPFGAISRATISTTTVTTAALASFVAAMYADLKAHGLLGN